MKMGGKGERRHVSGAGRGVWPAHLLLLVVVLGHDAAHGSLLDEVHAVAHVALPDDQIARLVRLRHQSVRQVHPLIFLGTKEEKDRAPGLTAHLRHTDSSEDRGVWMEYRLLQC